MQHEELRRSFVPIVLDTSFDNFTNVAKLEHEDFILENENACLKSLLDD